MARPRKSKMEAPVVPALPLYDHPPAPEPVPVVDDEAQRGIPTNWPGIRRIDN